MGFSLLSPSDSEEKNRGEFTCFAKRDITGNAVYRVYQRDGFYYFYSNDGTVQHEHSTTMNILSEGFTKCSEDGSSPSPERTTIRNNILKALPDVPAGTPALLGDGTVACAIALALYGEHSPCLPGDISAESLRHCA